MPVIEVEGLRKEFGDVVAVEDLSFAVEEGEVFGYLGPNGAGKTTTIRTLLGFLSPTAGTARLFGHDVRDAGELRAARRRVGYLPSALGFDPGVTGRRFLDYQGALKGDARREELLALFDVPLERPVETYSTGNTRKLGIVQAFMHDPALVVLDEPTSGLDPLMQERFYEFVETERERGTTVFFSSHILGEVRRVCDRVGILRAGSLAALEDVETLLDRSGKLVRVTVADPLPADAFAVEGVHDREHASEREVRFTFTGDYDELVAELGRYDLVDLDVREAPLEDVFMRFYGPDEDERAETAAADTDATEETTGEGRRTAPEPVAGDGGERA